MRSLKRVSAVILAALLALCALPAAAFAADATTVNIDFSGIHDAYNGYEGELMITTTGDGDYTVKLSADNGIHFQSTDTYVVTTTAPNPITLKYDIKDSADEDTYTITAEARATSTNALLKTETFDLYVSRKQDQFSSAGGAAFNVYYSVNGSEDGSFKEGESGDLTINLFNKGNADIRNATVSLELPSCLYIERGTSTEDIGMFMIGRSASVTYKLACRKDTETTSYPIKVTVTGVNTGQTVSASETIYVPVEGAAASSKNADLEITNIQVPANVAAEKEFTLSFSVRNNGKSEVKEIDVSVEMPADVINTSQNSFMINRLEAGASQSFSVKCKSQKGGESKAFKITAVPTQGKGTVSQYASTLVGSASSDVKAPILMVSGYSYGGEPIMAGDQFPLSLTLLNTNGATSLRNIKMTVTSDDNAFIPVGSSNSKYIASIAPGQSSTQYFTMSCGRDAAQSSHKLTVNMSYENAEGAAFTSSDVISVPVIQKIRLVVDDILDPGWLTTTDQCYITVNYRNMGNIPVNNLLIQVEGDFTMDSGASYYVGNMASGKSDYYSFNFFPNQAGPCKGTVTFTYEDGGGTEQTLVKEFTLNIGEGWVPEPMPEEDFLTNPDPQKLPLWVKIVVPVAVLIGIIVAVKLIKRHKAKKQEALDLDD